ncbi:MAG: hypothetical protein GEU78_01630 [Actinobacteria bacterium]|nr:hypothetical protein [Actinomycetota bacterium]
MGSGKSRATIEGSQVRQATPGEHPSRPPTDVENPKVLFLLGKGRAGGTLLNNVLGQLEGFTAPGELPRLWTWGLTEGWLCGCGRPVRDCPYWKPIVDRVLADSQGVSPAEVTRWQNELLTWRKVPRLLLKSPDSLEEWPTLASYVGVMGNLYRAIARATGARVIVESTRWPTAPSILGLVPGMDVRVLHLVRDPRAVIYSWKRRKALVDRPGNPEMQRFGATYTMVSWWARSFLAELVSRRWGRERAMLLRYEDFIADPNRNLETILSFVGEPKQNLGFVSDGFVQLDTTHTVGGNPDRLRSGRVELRLDDAWVQGQALADRLIGTVLATPYLRRYGYPFFPKRASWPDDGGT